MTEVSLSDFVSRTMIEILEGVSAAQDHAKGTGAKIGPPGYSFHQEFEPVEFDVAVTSREGESARGGLGVFLANVGIGGQVEADASREGTNRIRFSVPIRYPNQGA